MFSNDSNFFNKQNLFDDCKGMFIRDIFTYMGQEISDLNGKNWEIKTHPHSLDFKKLEYKMKKLQNVPDYEFYEEENKESKVNMIEKKMEQIIRGIKRR